MANYTQLYDASAANAITLAALATSATLVAGRQGPAIDNGANARQDYHLAGTIMTGTTPTVGVIEVNLVAMRDDLVWPAGFGSADAARTFTTVDIKNAVCRLVCQIANTTTSNQPYDFGPYSVASIFGGFVPKKFCVFVTHSTVAALNATGTNHVIALTPLYTGYAP